MVLTFLQQKNCNIFDTTIEIAYTSHRKLAYEEKECEQAKFLYI